MNHTTLKTLAVCAALAAPALASTPALAQQAPPTADLLARQRALFDQANKAYDQGRQAEAEGFYIEAWKLKKSFDVAGNLGNLEADLKKWRFAGELLSYALREFPAGGKPALREDLLRRMAEVQQHVGSLRIQVNRSGAEVFVDGTSVGTSPLAAEIYVEPGNHLVEARFGDLPPAQVNVATTKGPPIDVTVVLRGKGANKGVVVAGAVITGLAAIAGGVFTGLWASKGSDAKNLAGQVPKNNACAAGGVTPQPTSTCTNLVSDLNSQATFGTAAVGSFIGAGVVGLATLTYGLVGARNARSALTVSPIVTAQGGGLFVGGSF
jgi:PEGA domain